MSYNGWTNYATWSVNLEIFGGIDSREYWRSDRDAYDLSLTLKDYAEELIDGDGLARDYALAFLADVNWYEIAEHMIADYADEKAA